MDANLALPLLGGLSPAIFMQRYWHRKPLLVRQAVPGFEALLSRQALFDLAAREDVESRLVAMKQQRGRAQWTLRRGPFARRALPPLRQPNWTLLVQGVDLHDDRVHALMNQFRFVPDARLDDLMISYASLGGGVGPHYDSYDVFLLQAQGRRRWRIGKRYDPTLRDGVPVKLLANFEPEQEFVLEPGDMLYLPHRYAHDGISEDEACMTYSIGFRSPARGELAQDLLQRLAEEAGEALGDARYRDAGQPAVAQPGAIPVSLQDYAAQAVRDALKDKDAVARALGEHLSEPKPSVWFEPGARTSLARGVVLDRRSRMMYDQRHIYINGESYRAGGRDATLMRRFADERRLEPEALARASADALELLQNWCEAGWAHGR